MGFGKYPKAGERHPTPPPRRPPLFLLLLFILYLKFLLTSFFPHLNSSAVHPHFRWYSEAWFLEVRPEGRRTGGFLGFPWAGVTRGRGSRWDLLADPLHLWFCRERGLWTSHSSSITWELVRNPGDLETHRYTITTVTPVLPGLRLAKLTQAEPTGPFQCWLCWPGK